jgi:hypothetical protein
VKKRRTEEKKLKEGRLRSGDGSKRLRRYRRRSRKEQQQQRLGGVFFGVGGLQHPFFILIFPFFLGESIAFIVNVFMSCYCRNVA